MGIIMRIKKNLHHQNFKANKKIYTNTNRLIFLPICAFLSFGMAGCKPNTQQEPVVRAVKTMVVAPAMVTATETFSAEIKPAMELKLGFRVGGKLLNRTFSVGQFVKKGTLLAQLDPQDYQLATQSAQAQLQNAKNIRDLAAADFARYKVLKEQGFISGAELEHRQSGLKSAQSQVESAQAQSNNQSNQAQYTQLFAPQSGVVLGVEAEAGQVVALGTPILRLALVDAAGSAGNTVQKDAVFAVAENKIHTFHVGQSVKVRAATDLGKNTETTEKAAKIREISAIADAVTRTFWVKARVDGTDFPLGSTVEVDVQSSPATNASANAAIKIPTTAMRQESGQWQVWILDPKSMTVKTQAITLASGAEFNGNDVVVQNGLTAGQVVVSTGVHVLAQNQKVSFFKNPQENTKAANQ